MASFLTALIGLDAVIVERSRHLVEFVAAPDRTYTPFVDDRCARKWFWIGDSDRYVPRSATLKRRRRGKLPPTWRVKFWTGLGVQAPVASEQPEQPITHVTGIDPGRW